MADEAGIVEQLVVKLTGDGTGYSKMLQEVLQETQQVSEEVTGFITRIEGFAAGAASALASLGVMDKLKESLGNFQEAETIGMRLDAVLEANGRNAEELAKRYGDVAVALEKTTTMEDDATLALFAKAEAFDATGAAAEKAVKDAIYLAAATGQSAEGMIRLTAALARGDVSMAQRFARMIPQLKGVKNELEFVEKAQKLVNVGMKTAEKEMNTSAGMLKVLQRDWGNLLELFGEIVAKGIAPVVKGLTDLVNWMKEWDEQTVLVVTTVAGLVAGFLAIGPAISTLGVLAGLVFNPVVAVLVAAGVAAAKWVDYMGGVGEAWEYVMARATEAYNYLTGVYDDLVKELKPITDALRSLWGTVKEEGGKAWEWVKEKGAEAWEWVKAKAEDAGRAIAAVWNRMTGGTLSTWDDIKRKIQEVVLFAEFSLKNFGQVSEYVWTGVQLRAVEALNGVLYALEVTWKTLELANAKTLNEMVRAHEVAWATMKMAPFKAVTETADLIKDVLGGTEIIAALVVFRTNWIALWKGASDYITKFAIDVIRRISILAALIPQAMAGKQVSLIQLQSKIAADVEIDFERTRKTGLDRIREFSDQLERELNDVKTGKAGGVPFLKEYQRELEAGLKELRRTGGGIPELRKLQDDLQERLDRQGGKIGEDFRKWRRVWEQEVAWEDFWEGLFPEDKVAEAVRKGEDAGKQVAGAFEKGEGKFDAAARNSVEALGRIQAYLDRMGAKEKDKNKGSDAVKRFDASAKASPEALQRQDAQTELLKKLVALNEKMLEKDTIDVEPLNLA